MKQRILISVILLVAAVSLSACGSGGTFDPNAPATVTLSASKAKALANGSDGVVMEADVRKKNGDAVADGTLVSFRIQNGGSLSASMAATDGGLASVTVTRAPITDATVQTVPVTCASGVASDSREVKFINAPTKASVFISFNREVIDLAALSFKLNSTAGVSFNNSAQPITAVNAAAGSLVVGNYNAVTNKNTIGLVSGLVDGFNTGTNRIIEVTYAVTDGATLPEFSIDDDPSGFSATNGGGAATTPPVSAADMTVTVIFDTDN